MGFERENRYIVLKLSDVDSMNLTDDEKAELKHICDAIHGHRTIVLGKQPLECVVVESDWPEYEPTWKAIQERVEADSKPDGWWEDLDSYCPNA